MLLLGLPVDPIVLRFQRATVGREGTSDCTRLPLLQDLPVLLPLVLHHPVDPIQPGRPGTSDCTRLPLLQDLPVLLPLVLHHSVDPIQPGRPVVGLQPGRSVAGLPVVGLPSGKVHQKVPKKVPLFLPWPFGDPVMFFPPITPPPLPGTPPVSL